MAAVSAPLPLSAATLTRLRLGARVALAVVWLVEGAVLKLWLHEPTELAIVAQSGLWVVSPVWTLESIGWLEVAAGLVLLSGWRERLAVVVTTMAMTAITLGVVWTEPSTLLAPLTGVFKNGALAVCATVVWVLAERRAA